MITNAKDGSVMVLVPAGSFLRGSAEGQGENDERPQKSIHLEAFHIDKQEVTVARYRKCVQAGKCTGPGGVALAGRVGVLRATVDRPRARVVSRTTAACNWGHGLEDHPVNCVDWKQARKYCAWAGGRLPSEAEWEKAARGIDGRKYPWGNAEASCGRAVMDDGGVGCGTEETWEVGSKPLGDSPYGAQDMAGNVTEWVSDWYDQDYYGRSPARNPAGASSGTKRVVRGGSWNRYRAENFRAANRDYDTPTLWSLYIGFRCVRTR